MSVLISEYLDSRSKVFKTHPLKPKHHYLCHYPELIVCFGPLIRLWTLRFESKHTYFKQCARKLHNFKNLCATLAERHQYLQAYLSAGHFFPPEVVAERVTDFYHNDYSDKIRQCISDRFQPYNTTATHVVRVKGTLYKRNMCVPLHQTEEGLVIGKIELILIHNSSNVYFVVDLHHTECLIDEGVYLITQQRMYACVNQHSLWDYYPLSVYTMCGLPVIVLHHSYLFQ